MSWTTEIKRSAEKELDALPDSAWQEAMDAIEDFAEDPFPAGSLELEGHPGLYRIRFYGDRYRLIYRISDQQRRVIIERARLRKDAYRGLD